MSVKVIYWDGVKTWIRAATLRDSMLKARGTGAPLHVEGNLDTNCQQALLKSMEELTNVTVVTATRLIAPLESRATEIEGNCPFMVGAAFVGIAQLDKRAAMALTSLSLRLE